MSFYLNIVCKKYCLWHGPELVYYFWVTFHILKLEQQFLDNLVITWNLLKLKTNTPLPS